MGIPTAEPTLALIHGGGTSAAQWDLLTPHLTSPWVAPDVPGRGDRPADVTTLTLQQAVQSVARDIAGATAGAPLVLVVHSSGGLLVPGVVAALDGQVGRVVLIAASVTRDGGTGYECMKPAHADGLRQLRQAADAGLARAATPAEPPSRERLEASWGRQVTPAQLDFITAPQRWVSDTINFYGEPLDWSAVRALPVAYLLTTRDWAVPPALQREMAARVGAAVIPLMTGHLPFVTMPEVIAALLNGQVGYLSE